jgi:hypothetical protein
MNYEQRLAALEKEQPVEDKDSKFRWSMAEVERHAKALRNGESLDDFDPELIKYIDELLRKI